MTRTVDCQLNGQPATECCEEMRPSDTQPCTVNCPGTHQVNKSDFVPSSIAIM